MVGSTRRYIAPGEASRSPSPPSDPLTRPALEPQEERQEDQAEDEEHLQIPKVDSCPSELAGLEVMRQELEEWSR